MSFDWTVPVSQPTHVFSVRTPVGRIEVAQAGLEQYQAQALLEAQYGKGNVNIIGTRMPGDIIGR